MKRAHMIALMLIIPLVIALVLVFRFRRTLIPMIDETKYLWPVPGHLRISSKFGPRKAPTPGASTVHGGIDIPAPMGTDVVAPWDGVVQSLFYTNGGGQQLVIEHTDGRVTGYAHLLETLVSAGQNVTRGQVVAKVGSTGRSTGPHLHFTLKPSLSADKIDPESLYA